MEKLESWVYGFIFLLGGVFLLIYAGVSLIDLISKTIFYFLLIFGIIVMLYGIFLILVGILLMPVNIRVKKSAALIIFLIGMIIIVLAISVILLYSFTNVYVFEILSGIGLIFLGIRLFLHPKMEEEGIEKIKKIIGFIGFIIGLIISLPFGYSLIMTIVLLSPENALYEFPFSLLPFLIGIILLKFSIYSIKPTHSTQERKNKSIFSILMGALIILTSYFATNSVFNLSFYFIFYTPYFPVIFSFIGIVFVLYGFLLQQNTRKRSPDN